MILQATSTALTVSDGFWVTADGTMLALSRPWIGPALGHVQSRLLVRP